MATQDSNNKHIDVYGKQCNTTAQQFEQRIANATANNDTHVFSFTCATLSVVIVCASVHLPAIRCHCGTGPGPQRTAVEADEADPLAWFCPPVHPVGVGGLGFVFGFSFGFGVVLLVIL